MGYTTGEINHEDMSLPQTPENVKAVRVRAGWTGREAADALNYPGLLLLQVEQGKRKLPDDLWREFLSKAGRRVFDHE